jgi:hypothetical protein
MNPKQFIELLENYGGILVGSRKWGCNNDHSDWDYIIPSASLPNIMSSLNEGIYEIRKENYNDIENLIILIVDTHFNIIPLSRRLYQCWSDASEMMLKAPVQLLANRDNRRYTFTMLCDFMKHFVYTHLDPVA